ncbi:MAG: hypothetical protein JWO59_212 [Chloroflexi bacterium]|nr:hypothetical protein [Chloroflexota bacterium]
MTTWTGNELTIIGNAEALSLAAIRRDGTLGDRVVVGVVLLGGDLYVRAYRGTESSWFRSTQVLRKGRIWAGGVEKDVGFEVANEALADEIDAAYRSKYGHHSASITNLVTSPAARAATLKLVPR